MDKINGTATVRAGWAKFLRELVCGPVTHSGAAFTIVVNYYVKTRVKAFTARINAAKKREIALRATLKAEGKGGPPGCRCGKSKKGNICRNCTCAKAKRACTENCKCSSSSCCNPSKHKPTTVQQHEASAVASSSSHTTSAAASGEYFSD